MMNKKDKEHVEKLIKGGFFKPGLTEKIIKLSLGIKLDEIHRMLHWLIAEMIHTDKDVLDEMRLRAECNQPDITDILKGEVNSRGRACKK